MEIPLRDYQTECLGVILAEYEEGVVRQLISLPTGSGKTVIMSALARHLNKKTLIIAHRQELITQAVEKFKLFWPLARVGVCMGDKEEIDCQVVIGSVQSCSRPKRLAKLKEQGFELMMIDEEFDILGGAHFIWIPIGEEWSLMDDEKREIVMSPCEGGFISTLYLPDGTSLPLVKTPLPLEYCSGVCEDYARENLKVVFAKSSSLLKKLPCTPAQKEYLKKKNAWFEGITKSQSALKIREIITLQNKHRRSFGEEPLSDKQRYFLQSRGVKTDGMSKLQGMGAISKIKQDESG